MKPGFSPWFGKIPWRSAWQSTPLFFPGEFHGQRSMVGFSPWGHEELDTSEQHTHIYTFIYNVPHDRESSGTHIHKYTVLFFVCVCVCVCAGQKGRGMLVPWRLCLCVSRCLCLGAWKWETFGSEDWKWASGGRNRNRNPGRASRKSVTPNPLPKSPLDPLPHHPQPRPLTLVKYTVLYTHVYSWIHKTSRDWVLIILLFTTKFVEQSN